MCAEQKAGRVIFCIEVCNGHIAEMFQWWWSIKCVCQRDVSADESGI